MTIKASRKYTTRFRKMAFGGDPETETLSHEVFYDEKGNISAEVKFNNDTDFPERHEYTYDAQGKLTSHHLILEQDGISETYVFTRDEKGRPVSEVKMYGEDEGERTVYHYDAHDHPVKIERFDPDGEPESSETIHYNSSDLPEQIIKRSPDGNTTETILIEYQDKNPVRRIAKDSKGNITSETTFSYDDKQQLIRVTEKNSGGVVVSDILTSYDERGNVVERKVRDFHTRTMKFKYDDRDNCIEEEMYDENGNLIMKNTFEFDEGNRMISESAYYMDLNRSHEMANTVSRFEYEFFG